MKFQFLGTAAAEGNPGLFCQCYYCKKAREHGGKDIRTRSQALIDDTLLIDFGADTMHHAVTFGLNLDLVKACIITHSHSDHLYPKDIETRAYGYSYRGEGALPILPFYGSAPVGKRILEVIGEDSDYASFTEVKAFESFDAAGYTVTPLPGRHDPGAGTFMYSIEKDGKAVFYGHDTGPLFDEVWAWLEKRAADGLHYDLVSLDCVGAASVLNYDSHNDIWRDRAIRNRMLELGVADEKTKFVANHFSHNGTFSLYDDFLPYARMCGFDVSYDGMTLEL